MLPVILGNTVCGLLIVAATRQEKWKVGVLSSVLATILIDPFASYFYYNTRIADGVSLGRHFEPRVFQ